MLFCLGIKHYVELIWFAPSKCVVNRGNCFGGVRSVFRDKIFEIESLPWRSSQRLLQLNHEYYSGKPLTVTAIIWHGLQRPYFANYGNTILSSDPTMSWIVGTQSSQPHLKFVLPIWTELVVCDLYPSMIAYCYGEHEFRVKILCDNHTN